MKKFNVLTLTTLLSFMTLFTSYAQKSPMKYGKIDKEDLTMTECSIEKDADAMVICEYGTMQFKIHPEFGFQTTFVKHVRVKVFNKEGLDQGNIEIPYFSAKAGAEERISNIKATSYQLVGGKVVESKLDTKTGVFEEKINKNNYIKKFVVPNVKEGSVFEYSYRVTSNFYENLRSWAFQKEIPVKWSEYIVTIPTELATYQQIIRGNPSFTLNDKKDTYETYNTTRGSSQFRATRYHWISENLVGLSPEPYTASPKDYATQVEFQMTGIKRNGSIQPLANTYEKFNKTVVGRYKEVFGEGALLDAKLNGHDFLKKLALEITASETDKLQKAIKIYEHLKLRMTSRSFGYYPAGNYKKAYEAQEASAPTINFMMIIMLKSLDINVSPVILSTRANGRPHPVYPNSERFNYVVNMVDIDGSNYLADPSYSDFLPFGTLPAYCLNGNGWKVDEHSGGWVNLRSNVKSNVTYYGKFEITKEGMLEGNMSITYSSYDGMGARVDQYKDAGLQKSLEKDLDEWEFSSFASENDKDFYQPFKVSFDLKKSGFDEEMIYFNPSIYGLETENPFKDEVRKMPVDFPYAQSRRYILTITLPEGYVVEDLPKPIRASLPNKGGSFTFNATQNGQTITLMNNLKINQTFFLVKDYAILRQLYDMVVAKNAEQLVIKKTAE